MKFNSVRLALIAFLSLPHVVYAGLFGPSNYDECVLQSMKGVTSDVAARAIALSCRTKFAGKSRPTSQLPSEVMQKLDGRGQLDLEQRNFFGSIYNGSTEWTVASITVRLTEKLENKNSASAKTRYFQFDIEVAPLSSSQFFTSVGVIDWASYDWRIVGANGYRK